MFCYQLKRSLPDEYIYHISVETKISHQGEHGQSPKCTLINYSYLNIQFFSNTCTIMYVYILVIKQSVRPIHINQETFHSIDNYPINSYTISQNKLCITGNGLAINVTVFDAL
jgi:hypothetical protein